MRLDRREILVFGCSTTGWERRDALGDPNLTLVPVSCAGSLHSSAIETALRRGVGGGLILSCPDRDCRFREGPKWLQERLFAGREAELHERVDRRRVRCAALSLAEAEAARREVAALREQLAILDDGRADDAELAATCRVDAAVVEAEEVHA